MLRKFGIGTALGFVWLTVLAVPALAASEINHPNGPQIKGVVIHAAGGTAFTGANISMGALVAAMLFVTGVVLLVARRRRAVAQ